ncbi:MAG: hypothetical protein C0433_10320 [Cyclobacterium sp.]|nr:hypothetical protein [Cyclobacterium sp.]
MRSLAEEIYEIIKDYHFDHGDCKHPMSVEHILNWANQFGDNAQFVLQEFSRILVDTYISKAKAEILALESLVEFQKFYKYSSLIEFLRATCFLDLQPENKSQKELLDILDKIIREKTGSSIEELQLFPKKHFLYVDDILATGGTLYRDLKSWLLISGSAGTNLDLILNGSITLASSFFCVHQLGQNNSEWALIQNVDKRLLRKLPVRFDYLVENQVKWTTQKLNCLIPIANQPKHVLEYLNSLEIPNPGKADAFRSPNQPSKEVFFSNDENRLRFEQIFLEKGIELLGKVKSSTPDLRKRPLGDTVKSHRTFGTGTMFFTWRNVSNTCPLAFWWDVPGHEWIPLFCVKNRGLSR